MHRILTSEVGRREVLRTLSCLLAPGAALTQAAADASKKTIRLGDSSVELALTGHSPPGYTYFHPHENEKTSAEVAGRFIQRRGGRLIELKGLGTRLVTFDLNGAHYTFDPNRIFSDVGVENTLRRYGAYSRAAHDAVVSFRNAVIGLLRKDPRLIIAMHNNEEMSVESYSPGHEFAQEAVKVSIDPKRSIHDFFLVLDPEHFEALRQAAFNVVLQSATPTDDGSLSVWALKNGVHYVNVEGGFGHADQQTEMLEALTRIADKGHSKVKSAGR